MKPKTRTYVTNKEYLKQALRTDREDQGYVEFNKENNTGSKGRFINGALGLAGECGEVVDLIKKHTQFNKELDVDKLKEELGDVLWYVAIIVSNIDSSFDEIMKLNIEKLNKRFPTSFSEQDALTRLDTID